MSAIPGFDDHLDNYGSPGIEEGSSIESWARAEAERRYPTDRGRSSTFNGNQVAAQEVFERGVDAIAGRILSPEAIEAGQRALLNAFYHQGLTAAECTRIALAAALAAIAEEVRDGRQ